LPCVRLERRQGCRQESLRLFAPPPPRRLALPIAQQCEYNTHEQDEAESRCELARRLFSTVVVRCLLGAHQTADDYSSGLLRPVLRHRHTTTPRAASSSMVASMPLLTFSRCKPLAMSQYTIAGTAIALTTRTIQISLVDSTAAPNAGSCSCRLNITHHRSAWQPDITRSRSNRFHCHSITSGLRLPVQAATLCDSARRLRCAHWCVPAVKRSR